MTEVYTPFIISEDEALRDLLKGMTVEDDKSPNRPVGVWFGQPDVEIRDQAFPYFTIDLIDVAEGTERIMAGITEDPWYYPAPEMTVDGVQYDSWSMPNAIPINLDYQITSFSRNPRHDRQILAQTLGNRLPFRFGSLNCKAITTTSGDNVTYDVTTRRLDMLGVAKRDTVEAGKKMFMNIFTVHVSSELPSPYVARLHKRVSTIGVGIGGYDPLHGVTDGPPSFKETFTITAPVGTP